MNGERLCPGNSTEVTQLSLGSSSRLVVLRQGVLTTEHDTLKQELDTVKDELSLAVLELDTVQSEARKFSSQLSR